MELVRKYIILFFILLYYFSYSQINSEIGLRKVEVERCVAKKNGDLILSIRNGDFDKIEEQFFIQNSDIDKFGWAQTNVPYKNQGLTEKYPNLKDSYMVDGDNPKIFYLKFLESVLYPKKYFPVEVTYYDFQIPPTLNNEPPLYGCLLNDELSKFDLTQISMIKAFINVPPDKRLLRFYLYRNNVDLELEQNAIPESEWTNFTLRKGEEAIIYLKMYFSDTRNKCNSISTINLKLKDYSIQMDKTEFEFCGTPFVVNGPDNQSNYEWYFNGDLKSTKKEVKVDALGEWIVYFDNDLGCKSSVKINVIPEKERSRIEKVTATSNSITIIPFPNANIDSYSLDGITFQNSGTFFNQTADLISIWYKTKLGCVFGPIPFDIANGFNFLSPNGDGINDTWSLRNKDFYKNAKIQIFDRYGKIVANGIVNDILPWNGKHNNFVLPTGTYWFIIKDDKETLKTGYIVLKTK